MSSGRGSRPLGAARQREYEKMQKYAELATLEGATVVPLVLESTGALGEGFRQFIHRISSRIRDGEFAGISPLGIERFLVNALAIALQRGNAAVLREGVNHLLLLRPAPLGPPPGHAASAFSLRSAYGWGDGALDSHESWSGRQK